MHDLHFHSLDLNLLRVSDTLIEERSVTRAGERLGLSQSAISHALNRLRYVLRDDCSCASQTARDRRRAPPKSRLVCGKGCYSSNSRWDQVEFVPERTERRFTITCGEYVGTVLSTDHGLLAAVQFGDGIALSPHVFDAGNRIRVTAQIVEAETGTDLWAERYDLHLRGAGRDHRGGYCRDRPGHRRCRAATRHAQAAWQPRCLGGLPAWLMASEQSYFERHRARGGILSAGQRSRSDLFERLHGISLGSGRKGCLSVAPPPRSAEFGRDTGATGGRARWKRCGGSFAPRYRTSAARRL